MQKEGLISLLPRNNKELRNLNNWRQLKVLKMIIKL